MKLIKWTRKRKRKLKKSGKWVTPRLKTITTKRGKKTNK